MSIEENKAVVGRWFTEFWGKDFNPAVIDELAAPDIRFEYSLHTPLRGRDAVRTFAGEFRAAFPDLNFWGTADLIAALIFAFIVAVLVVLWKREHPKKD